MNLRYLNMMVQLGFVPAPSLPAVISSIRILKKSGESVDADVETGVNFQYMEECNNWPEYILQALAGYALSQNASSSPVQPIIMTQDIHWNWFSKYPQFFSSEYLWFFIKAEGEIQAAAIIYHPKASALLGDNIFYIEYVSVAPWNRSSNLHSKRFPKLAPLFLKNVQSYIRSQFGYRYGFSLHSLPQAERFYNSIGMHELTALTKDGMKYFEFEEAPARKFAEGVQI